MHIIINEKTYLLTKEQEAILTAFIHAKIEHEYTRLEPQWRLAAKAASRAVLTWIEERIKKETGSLDKAKSVRPERGADPVPHLFTVGSKILGDMLGHVTIHLATCEETRTIEGFRVSIRPRESRDGGPVDSDGDLRVRENDGLKVPGHDVHPALPAGQTLHPGLKT